MHKCHVSQSERFNLSQKLLKILSQKQLLMLIPSIISKLIFKSNLNNESKSSTINSNTLFCKDYSKWKEESCYSQNSIDTNCTSINISDESNTAIFTNDFVQKAAVECMQNEISTRMTNELFKKCLTYTGTAKESTRGDFSPLNDVLHDFTTSNDKIQKESSLKKYTKIKKCSSFDTNFDKSGRFETSIYSQYHSIFETKHPNYFNDSCDYFTYQYSHSYACCKGLIEKSKRLFQSVNTETIETYESYKVRISNQMHYNRKPNKSSRIHSPLKNKHFFTAYVEVSVDLTDHSVSLKTRNYTKFKSIKTIDYDLEPFSNSIPIWNVKNNKNIYVPIEQLSRNKRDFSNTIMTNCNISLTTNIHESKRDQSPNKKRFDKYKKFKSLEKNKMKDKIKNDKLKSEYKNNLENNKMALAKNGKSLLAHQKKMGMCNSRIINGRLRHGWQCTYKECLLFNCLDKPTCSKCFNQRFSQPSLSKRDIICRDCGYINYKSRLYCKKCKFIFMKNNSLRLYKSSRYV